MDQKFFLSSALVFSLWFNSSFVILVGFSFADCSTGPARGEECCRSGWVVFESEKFFLGGLACGFVVVGFFGPALGGRGDVLRERASEKTVC